MNAQLYNTNLIQKRIYIPVNELIHNVRDLLLEYVNTLYTKKCIKEGIVKEGSVQLRNYSCGHIEESNIWFDIVFECMLCCPVEGLIIDNVIIKNITKAGIRGEINEKDSPLIIFIARDHKYNDSKFNELKENDTISITVIGQRYEINDSKISVIADIN